jgi:hypothetical protein
MNFGYLRWAWFLVAVGLLQAQLVSLPETPDEFGAALKEALERFKRPDITARAQAFFSAWETGDLSLPEKKAIASLASRLHKKGLKPYPELLRFVEAALLLKNPETRIRAPVPQFVTLSESLAIADIAYLPKFWDILAAFVPQGIVNKTSIFEWRIDKSEAHLGFYTYYDSAAFEEKQVPAFFFKKTNLICATGGQEIMVKEVDGALNLTNRRFIGSRGKADWSRLGVGFTELYADLGEFTVDMNVRRLWAPRATLHYATFLPGPVVGHFEDDFTISPDPLKARSPAFEMIEGSIEIKEFIPNTVYRGGFALLGLTKYGSSVGDTLAELSVFAKNKEVMRVYLSSLAFDPKKLTAREVAVELYLPFGDTIYYPFTDLIYDVATQHILLNRDRKNPNTRKGFYSTYHKMEMLFDAIEWRPLTDTFMRFTAIIDPKGKYGLMQSIDFFNQREYELYKSVTPINPLGAIYGYMKEQEKARASRRRRNVRQTIRDADLIKYLNLDPKIYMKALQERLKEIETYGFIRYEPTLGIIEPLPKLVRWAQAAFGEKDYDAIRIFSNTSDGENARLDLQNKELTLRGVEAVVFADSHIVEIAPYKRTIYVGENRSMRFAGRLAAGKTDLYVWPEPRMQFDYANFKVLFFNVDSLKFKPERDPLFAAGKYPRVGRSLATLRIENVSGCVYIDVPNNKNGRRVLPQYSVLDCYTESYKYWDAPTIQKGNYKRDKLFFELDPFMLDSLEIFSLVGLEFHGVFYTDSLFPPFRDTLKIMPDGSYGIQEVFSEGIAIYRGKGKFYNRVAMDNFGFHGKGEIHYLTSKVQADTFVFYFDSCIAEKAKLLLPKSQYVLTKYPEVQAEDLRFRWYPYEGRMILETGKKPAQLYAGKARFRGELEYTPEGLKAKGFIETGEVEVESQSFALRVDGFSTKDGTFRIVDPKKPTDRLFVAEDVELDYSVDKEQADFTSLRVGEPIIQFPKQNIATSLGKGTYSRETGDIFLNPHVPDETKNYVIQRNPNGKEVVFNTQIMVYNLRQQTLEANRVDSILVADAVIFPEGGRVAFHADGRIAPLHRAVIKAPKGLNYHVILDATAKITSGEIYIANGRYKYTDVEGQPQFITLDSIYVQNGVTTAYAKISDGSGFLLTDRILFRDKVELRADRRFLYFDGEVRIQSDNEFLRESWFSFSGIVNPDTIFIPIKNPTNRKGQELTVGIHFISFYRNFYTNFLQPRRNKDDVDVLMAEGGLSVDRTTKAFRIGPEKKISGQSLRGNWVEYNDAARITTAYGRLQFPAAIPPGGAQLAMAGMWREEQRFQKLSTDLVWMLHFPNIPSGLMEAVANRMNSWALAQEDVDYSDQRLAEALAELLDPDTTQPETNTQELLRAAQRAAIAKNIPLGKKLPASFVFLHVPFRRSDSTGALFVTANVGVGAIGGISINKYVPAKIEYSFGSFNPAEKTRAPDLMTIYLEPTEGNWLFIMYSGHVVRMISGDVGLNRQIQSAADKQKDYNKDPSKPKLQLIAADPAEKEEFLSRFSAYLLR